MKEEPTKKINIKKIAERILKEKTNQKRSLEEFLNNNYVYITNDGKEPLMIKFIPENDRHRLETEVAMFVFLKKETDLNVPKILDFGEIDLGVYLIREIIKGETLEEYQKKSKNQIEKLYYDAGIILAKLHSIEFNDKGLFNPDLSISKYDIFSMKEYSTFIEKLNKKNFITAEKYSQLKKVDVDYYFLNKKNVLCHSDYTPKNILVEDKKIAGVIDFEWVSSAPFMDDMVTFHLFVELYGYEDKIKNFYEGYKTIKPIEDFYFDNINFYKFYRLITMVSYQLYATDDRFQGNLQNRMKEKLNFYIKEVK